jgi:hypothetical protein
MHSERRKFEYPPQLEMFLKKQHIPDKYQHNVASVKRIQISKREDVKDSANSTEASHIESVLEKSVRERMVQLVIEVQ